MIEDVEARLPLDQDELAALWLREVGVLYLEMFDGMAAGGLDLLARFPDDIPEPIHKMVESARRASALDVRRDEILRTKIWRSIQEIFSKYDGLLTPTLGALPVINAENGNTLGPTLIDGRPVEPCIGWCLTHPFNFTGHSAASVPAGLTTNGLPVGLQVVGRRFMDENVISILRHVEEVRPWVADLNEAVLRIEDMNHAEVGAWQQGS
jgi:amidase/aspartyl-tRNA(Asn)/glutamyl-tRNA(Gln) amidotransferase subunit A